MKCPASHSWLWSQPPKLHHLLLFLLPLLYAPHFPTQASPPRDFSALLSYKNGQFHHFSNFLCLSLGTWLNTTDCTCVSPTVGRYGNVFSRWVWLCLGSKLLVNSPSDWATPRQSSMPCLPSCGSASTDCPGPQRFPPQLCVAQWHQQPIHRKTCFFPPHICVSLNSPA